MRAAQTLLPVVQTISRIWKMQKLRPALLGLSLPAMLLVGCGTVQLEDPAKNTEAKRFQSKPDVGQIYVCRTSSFFGTAVRPTIQLDGKPVADIGRGTYFYAELPPGDHRLVIKTLEHNSEMPFTLAKGEQKFFQTWISAGFVAGWGLVDAMAPEEGKKCVSEGNLVATYEGMK